MNCCACIHFFFAILRGPPSGETCQAYWWQLRGRVHVPVEPEKFSSKVNLDFASYGCFNLVWLDCNCKNCIVISIVWSVSRRRKIVDYEFYAMLHDVIVVVIRVDIRMTNAWFRLALAVAWMQPFAMVVGLLLLRRQRQRRRHYGLLTHSHSFKHTHKTWLKPLGEGRG